jgi:hypothetical protein
MWVRFPAWRSAQLAAEVVWTQSPRGHRRAMLDGSQGIHPLESYPSQVLCVASATNDSASISGSKPFQEEYRALLERQGRDYDERRLWGWVSASLSRRSWIYGFVLRGINPPATFKASLRDAPQTGSLCHNPGCLIRLWSGRLACTENVKTPGAGFSACRRTPQCAPTLIFLVSYSLQFA